MRVFAIGAGRCDPPPPEAPATPGMRRNYARVLVLWVVVLAALYAMQEFFS